MRDIYNAANEKSIKEKQVEIITHYGFDKQLKQLREECIELALAICKLERHEYSKTSIDSLTETISEMADVLNLIEQMQFFDEFIGVGIGKIKEYKVNRELDRISREK